MDSNFIEERKADLLKLKQELLENVSAGNEDFKRIMQGVGSTDEADMADDDMNRKMIEIMGAKNMQRLNLIDNTLARINTGKYGVCLKCGKPIPQDRLVAIPYALMCIDCQSKEDRRFR
jgi:RNA polymerase-binding protein DksA